jgi:hypothetical protein
MGKAKRKLHLFKLYRRNIELLCENPRYNREALKDIVICPICFHTFKESDVEKRGENNYLTIEHVPPQYLGGRTEVLTCFKCNNLFSEFDKELLYVPQRPDSKVVNWRTKLKSNEDKFGAITEFDFNTNVVKFPQYSILLQHVRIDSELITSAIHALPFLVDYRFPYFLNPVGDKFVHFLKSVVYLKDTLESPFFFQ